MKRLSVSHFALSRLLFQARLPEHSHAFIVLFHCDPFVHISTRLHSKLHHFCALCGLRVSSRLDEVVTRLTSAARSGKSHEMVRRIP
jgi:hypothetical protein